MDTHIRLTPQTRTLLEALLEGPKDWHYGYDLSRATGLKSGTLYPILMRLANRQWLETRWEAVEPGKPPRHLYRLTPNGLAFAREACKSSAGARAAHRAALEGAKA
jgi:PadR family transcriptional regulator